MVGILVKPRVSAYLALAAFSLALGFAPAAAQQASCSAGSGKVTVTIRNNTNEDLVCNVTCSVTYPDKAIDWLHCDQKAVAKGKSGSCMKTTKNTYNGTTKVGTLSCQ